jgi:nitrogen-specific signal transduction histidine kinase
MPVIYADTDILMQVFINIMQNALDGMNAGELLAMQSFADGQNLYAEFRCPAAENSVQDPELMFLPFEDGGDSTGLPLAYRLVKDMGGVLSFSLEGREKVFIVSLPKTAPPDSV